MANEKIVIKDAVITMNPGGSAVDLSPFCKKVQLDIAKPDVNTSCMGDPADRHMKGPGGHQVSFDFLHARAQSAFLAKMATEFNLDVATPFEVKFRNATVDTDNRKFTFSALVITLPIGASRGEAASFSASWPIDGQVTMNDGTSDVLL